MHLDLALLLPLQLDLNPRPPALLPKHHLSYLRPPFLQQHPPQPLNQLETLIVRDSIRHIVLIQDEQILQAQAGAISEGSFVALGDEFAVGLGSEGQQGLQVRGFRVVQPWVQ